MYITHMICYDLPLRDNNNVNTIYDLPLVAAQLDDT